MLSTVKRAFEKTFTTATVTGDSDFFDLGGDSLAMQTIITELEQNLGVGIQGLDILHAPTVEELSQQISKLTGDSQCCDYFHDANAR